MVIVTIHAFITRLFLSGAYSLIISYIRLAFCLYCSPLLSSPWRPPSNTTNEPSESLNKKHIPFCFLLSSRETPTSKNIGVQTVLYVFSLFSSGSVVLALVSIITLACFFLGVSITLSIYSSLVYVAKRFPFISLSVYFVKPSF